MNRTAIRVVKLGGSLLDLPDVAARLRRWLYTQEPAGCLLLAGGGRLVEALRHYDQIHGLGEELCDCLAIRAMSISAALVAALLPEARLTDRLAAAGEALAAGELVVFDVLPTVASSSEPVNDLPRTWEVTSDSLAARLAAWLEASEFVLLKSALARGARTCQAVADAGLVDSYFPRAAAGLPRIRLVDLTCEGFAEQQLV